MRERVKVIGGFAILGFILGVFAYFMNTWLISKLIEVFPGILEATWLLWGMIGSVSTVSAILLWATITRVR